VWHLLVSHPRLKAAEMKWESTTCVEPSQESLYGMRQESSHTRHRPDSPPQRFPLNNG